MLYEIPLEQSLILNFFNSSIYFIFENEKEKDSFLNFINFYDSRFNKDFNKKDELKSVIWKFCPTRHQYQLEWDNGTEYFKKYDAIPVSYSLVMEYVDTCSKIHSLISDLAIEINKFNIT